MDPRRLAKEALEKHGKVTQGGWDAHPTDGDSPPAVTFAGLLLAEFEREEDAEFVAWCENNLPTLARAFLDSLEERATDKR